MDTNLLVKKIVRVCYDVQSELGCGFVEKVYERALAIALSEAGFAFEVQYPIAVSFRGNVIGEFYADLLVEGRIVVELKAVSAIESIHKAQMMNYLKASELETGVLVNFGSLKLEINRLYNRHLS